MSDELVVCVFVIVAVWLVLERVHDEVLGVKLVLDMLRDVLVAVKLVLERVLEVLVLCDVVFVNAVVDEGVADFVAVVVCEALDEVFVSLLLVLLEVFVTVAEDDVFVCD